MQTLGCSDGNVRSSFANKNAIAGNKRKNQILSRIPTKGLRRLCSILARASLPLPTCFLERKQAEPGAEGNPPPVHIKPSECSSVEPMPEVSVPSTLPLPWNAPWAYKRCLHVTMQCLAWPRNEDLWCRWFFPCIEVLYANSWTVEKRCACWKHSAQSRYPHEFVRRMVSWDLKSRETSTQNSVWFGKPGQRTLGRWLSAVEYQEFTDIKNLCRAASQAPRDFLKNDVRCLSLFYQWLF